MNMMQMMSQFPAFMQQMKGRNPREILNEKLRNGEITEQQIEQVRQQAEQYNEAFNQFRGMFGF